MVAVTVMELAESVAVLLTLVTVTSTSICSVEAVDEPLIQTVAVFAAAVIVPLCEPPVGPVVDPGVTVQFMVGAAAVIVPPVVPCMADIASVTPVGTLLNVSLMFEPFGAGVVLFELCVALRQHEAQPSVIRNDAPALAMLLFVKIEPVPCEPLPARAPTARPLVAMPGFSELMMVPVLVPKK